MTPEAFVDVIRQAVQQAAAEDMISLLESPPGRRPTAERLEQSAWYCGLPEGDRAMVQAVVAETSRVAVFGMLCALDGSRTILDPRGDGRIELRFGSSSHATLLAASDGSGDVLHDLL